MAVNEQLKQRIVTGLLPVACACFTIYLGYHGLYGQRGLFALQRLNHDIEQEAYALSQLRMERDLLERRTQLLRGDSLDPDLLDERARALLNFAEPDEVVIFNPQDLVDGNK